MIPENLLEIINSSATWVIRKIESKEPFSAVMVSKHPEGKKSSIYVLDDGNEVFARSEKDLQSHLKNTVGYSLAYDAWYPTDTEKIPMIICRVEEIGMQSQQEFGFLYRLIDGKVNPISKLTFLRNTEKSILKKTA